MITGTEVHALLNIQVIFDNVDTDTGENGQGVVSITPWSNDQGFDVAVNNGHQAVDHAFCIDRPTAVALLVALIKVGVPIQMDLSPEQY